MKQVIPRGLVVSCQALKEEPLYGGDTIPKMAYAAYLGGAVGIRANTVRDINGISRKLEGRLPIIGLIKKNYADSSVYITPTTRELNALIRSKCDVIAMDATLRPRPGKCTLEKLVAYARERTDKALMADIATFEEAMNADRLGFDYISTTLRSYTEETKGMEIPDPEFCKMLLGNIKNATVIAEGGIGSFASLREILDTGIDHIIIGGAITRPQNITKQFVSVIAAHSAFTAGEENYGKEIYGSSAWVR